MDLLEWVWEREEERVCVFAMPIMRSVEVVLGREKMEMRGVGVGAMWSSSSRTRMLCVGRLVRLRV